MDVRTQLTSAVRGPCVLDVTPSTVTTFAQGSITLVRADLAAALEPDAAARALGLCDSVKTAFALRRELCNLKKVALHLYHDACDHETSLKQLASYFYADEQNSDGGAACAHKSAHQRGLCAGGDAAAEEGMAAFTPSERYKSICRALSYCRGARAALHDARQLLKAICSLPRHPDNAWGPIETSLSAPQQLSVYKLLGRRRPNSTNHHAADDDDDKAAPAASAPTASPTAALLDSLLARAAAADVPAEEVQLLRCVLIARGGAKAVAMRHATQLLAASLDVAIDELKEAMHQAEAEAAVATGGNGNGNGGSGGGGGSSGGVAGGDDAAVLDVAAAAAALRPVIEADRSAEGLRAALPVLTELRRWLRRLLEVHDGKQGEAVEQSDAGEAGEAAKQARLFHAGDGRTGGAAMFVPSDFALGAPLRRCAAAVLTHRSQMEAIVVEEGWPPPHAARRGFVNGDVACAECGFRFAPLWIRRHVCCACEAHRRRAGRCPYRAQCSSAVFCTHQQRCLACEPASCEEGCNLVRGDGEAVSALAARHAPRLLLLDFDRTLASTRSGADPRKGEHTVDAELLSVASAAGVRVHVITRNPHAESIDAFLAARGVRATLHCVAGGGRDAKARVVVALLRQLHDEGHDAEPSTAAAALFVDDDAAEHVAVGEALRDEKGLPRCLRVLFVRG